MGKSKFPSGGEAPSAETYIPKGRVTLPILRGAVQGCRGCAIYKCGTRAVLGEGSVRPGGIMLVGEQPGDVEERMGRPFVGAAGKILDKALAEAGIDRARTYVTNAVKHFKFKQRGKHRIHSKPTAREAGACHPWLEREIEIVKPRAIVVLGATAAQSLLGRTFRITRDGGKVIKNSRWSELLLATAHPSSILRQKTDGDRHESYTGLVRDLKLIAKETGKSRVPGRQAGRGARSRAGQAARRGARSDSPVFLKD
jgi:DNA polymerase